MALAYGLYFITPMILATMLSLRGRREDFREMTTAVVLQMGIGFLLFLLLPGGTAALLRPARARRLRSAAAALVLRPVRAPARRLRQRRSGAHALGVPVAALQPRAAHADLLVPVQRRGVAAPSAAVVPHRRCRASCRCGSRSSTCATTGWSTSSPGSRLERSRSCWHRCSADAGLAVTRPRGRASAMVAAWRRDRRPRGW